MQYARIYADQSGESRLEEVEVNFSGTAQTPPAPPVDVAEPVNVTRHVIMRIPAGWAGDLHRVPRRQLMVMLSGDITVQASTGATRRFVAGDLLLLEDTEGKGHRTTNSGSGAAYVMMVHLA